MTNYNSPTNNVSFNTHYSDLVKADALLGYYMESKDTEKKEYIRNNYNRLLNNNNIIIF